MRYSGRDAWTWAVGVDISTTNCGLIVATRRGLDSQPLQIRSSITIKTGRNVAGDRIRDTVDRAQAWLAEEVHGSDVNVLAAIEEPIYYPGHRKDTQAKIARAVGALEYVLRCWGWRVELLKPGMWKAAVVGNMRAGKVQVGEAVRILTDGAVTDEHQADALGVLMGVIMRERRAALLDR